MSEPREPVTDALWANLWDDLRRHATGRISGREIIDQHRPAIEREAARAAVEARDRELREAVLQSPSRWVEFYDGNPSVPVISLAAVLALLHPADAG